MDRFTEALAAVHSKYTYMERPRGTPQQQVRLCHSYFVVAVCPVAHGAAPQHPAAAGAHSSVHLNLHLMGLNRSLKYTFMERLRGTPQQQVSRVVLTLTNRHLASVAHGAAVHHPAAAGAFMLILMRLGATAVRQLAVPHCELCCEGCLLSTLWPAPTPGSNSAVFVFILHLSESCIPSLLAPNHAYLRCCCSESCLPSLLLLTALQADVAVDALARLVWGLKDGQVRLASLPSISPCHACSHSLNGCCQQLHCFPPCCVCSQSVNYCCQQLLPFLLTALAANP